MSDTSGSSESRPTLITIGALTRRIGRTVDQLRNWQELGLISASRVGTQRVYGEVQVEMATIVSQLVASGLRPREIATALNMFSKDEGTRLDRLRILLATAEEGARGLASSPEEKGSALDR